ncbi:MAG: hypothetical protein Q9181_008222, partial [Wetmoreana brouardii]
MDAPDLSNDLLLALVEWFNRQPLWQRIAAEKTARWPIPSSLKGKLPVVSGQDTIVIGAQRVTDSLKDTQHPCWTNVYNDAQLKASRLSISCAPVEERDGDEQDSAC